jgi:hypothetical protein
MTKGNLIYKHRSTFPWRIMNVASFHSRNEERVKAALMKQVDLG